MMNRIKIDLENCYGIKKLEGTLEFTTERVYALYAPNGFMKSSLANVFEDVAMGRSSKDRIFPERPTKRSITDENGKEISADSVFVVGPYDSDLDKSEHSSVLLVDEKLKKEYVKLHDGVRRAKQVLLSAIKEQAKSKRDFEKEISTTFTSSDDEFQNALGRIQKELSAQTDAPLKDVRYDILFDERVLELIQSPDVRSAVDGYVKRYNELLGASTFFKKGTFDYYNAAQVAKSLTANGFFSAKHTVTLNGSKPKEIKTQKDLEQVIAEEKETIIKDPALRKQFDSVANQFAKNATFREFQSYLMENEGLLPRLSNVKKLREDVFKSYLKVHFNLYDALMKEYELCDARSKAIRAEALKQRTQWEDVISEFNNRFHVPFTLDVKNKLAVMLEDPDAVELAFTYKDGTHSKPVDKDSLITSLSTGERKALYVLNVIFHVQTRKKENKETLIVVDDIADSFDYQNKYAILQYLKDISDDPLFKQIIMTHNFDFFRTIESRLAKKHRCFMAVKTSAGIQLIGAQSVQNVFKRWKADFATDKKRKIGCIPFIRNLVEYTKGSSDPVFGQLTSLLHWKPNSMAVTEIDLDNIYNLTFPTAPQAAGGSGQPMVDIINAEAAKCLTGAAVGINFENKVVLSIAIRLTAERFMVNKINNASFWAGITKYQTAVLFGEYVRLFGRSHDAALVLDRVMLMTPENIHLNSFMYEPIVDMSDDHLRELYSEVLALK